MRKMVLLLVILTIFTFSIVYAQEIYSTDVNEINQEMNTHKNTETLKQEEQQQQKQEQQKEKKNIAQSSNIKKVQAVTSNDIQDKVISREKNDLSRKSHQESYDSKATKEKDNSNEKVIQKQDNNEIKKTKVSDGNPVIDVGNANNGSFKAKYLNNNKLKIMVIKDGKTYTHDLKGDNTYQSYPLQMGDGTYKISIMENISGKEYKYVLTKDVEVKTVNPNATYLTSVKMIKWDNSMEAIKRAKSLTNGLNDQQKVDKIHGYIVNNITYDTSITKLPSGYVPNINNIYNIKSGICYDFASIFAGMLRSVGVPTKLIKGQATNIEGYHAWNEVYINGSWKIVDTSYDAQLKAAKRSVTTYKSRKDYSASQQY